MKTMKLILLVSLLRLVLGQNWYEVPNTNMFLGKMCGNEHTYTFDIYLTPDVCVSNCRNAEYGVCTHASYYHSQCRLYNTCNMTNVSSSIVYEVLPTPSPSESPTSKPTNEPTSSSIRHHIPICVILYLLFV